MLPRFKTVSQAFGVPRVAGVVYRRVYEVVPRKVSTQSRFEASDTKKSSGRVHSVRHSGFSPHARLNHVPFPFSFMSTTAFVGTRRSIDATVFAQSAHWIFSLASFSKRSVQALCSNAISSMSFFGRSEKAQVLSLAVQLNARSKFSSAFVKANAFVTRSVVFLRSAVSMVLRRGRFAKIFPLIVKFFPVAMIDFIRRPCSGHPHPNNSMCKIFFVVDTYFYSLLIVKTSSFFAYGPARRKCFLPRQKPLDRIVIEKLSYVFRREVAKGVFGTAFHNAALNLCSGVVKC